MNSLNYHHLLYFWMVAREGGVAEAAARLRLTHPTVSSQIRTLERSLGVRLFQKRGRRLVPTETGQLVLGYADQIFGLGTEMLGALQGEAGERPTRLAVGIADVVPKVVAHALLSPAIEIRK